MAIAAFFVAVLMGMGVGGGGLLVVYLTLFAHLPQLHAQLINMIFFISSSAAAIVVNLFKKRLRLYVILFLSLGGVAGAVCGSAFANSTESGSVKIGFGIMLIALGAITLFSSKKEVKKTAKIAKGHK